MGWNDLTDNPKVLLGYFDRVPTLSHVVLHRLTLLRDGPTVEIVVEVPEFPDRVSKKWPADADTCQITISASDISEIEITKWGTGVHGELTISGGPGSIQVCFSGEAEFKFRSSYVDVRGVTCYARSFA